VGVLVAECTDCDLASYLGLYSDDPSEDSRGSPSDASAASKPNADAALRNAAGAAADDDDDDNNDEGGADARMLLAYLPGRQRALDPARDLMWDHRIRHDPEKQAALKRYVTSDLLLAQRGRVKAATTDIECLGPVAAAGRLDSKATAMFESPSSGSPQAGSSLFGAWFDLQFQL
jgi:hypothetical protein